MFNARILYVCQEMVPFVTENEMSITCRFLPQQMQDRGAEVRIFMPRYGTINERRNQLHEVIRLSGMNIVIDDSDHQLIIKVASIPLARLQVYFIDNEDYFQRKGMLSDTGGSHYEDNDERAVFFSRGVIETVSKLRWSPEIVHCHGWFSFITAAYIKEIYKDEPLFANSKVVLSLYGKDTPDYFPGTLDAHFRDKLVKEGVAAEKTGMLANPDYNAVVKFAMQYADGIVLANGDADPELSAYAKEAGIPVMESFGSENYAENYTGFYEEILGGQS